MKIIPKEYLIKYSIYFYYQYFLSKKNHLSAFTVHCSFPYYENLHLIQIDGMVTCEWSPDISILRQYVFFWCLFIELLRLIENHSSFIALQIFSVYLYLFIILLHFSDFFQLSTNLLSLLFAQTTHIHYFLMIYLVSIGIQNYVTKKLLKR